MDGLHMLLVIKNIYYKFIYTIRVKKEGSIFTIVL